MTKNRHDLNKRMGMTQLIFTEQLYLTSWYIGILQSLHLNIMNNNT